MRWEKKKKPFQVEEAECPLSWTQGEKKSWGKIKLDE